MKEPLVKTPLPPAVVERFQGVPAALHPVETAAGLSAGQAVQESLECVSRARSFEGCCVVGSLDGVVS